MLQRDRQRQRERGTFSAGGAVDFTAEYLVIAGGGGGGNFRAGGGGAGGYRSSVTGESSGGGASAESPLSIALGDPYTVTVGAGGAGGAATTNATMFNGANGQDSIFSSIISLGGGGGGASGNNGLAGGSGGGGSGGTSTFLGGSGTANQGYDGGNNGQYGAGGGGGAGSVGANGIVDDAGNGGDGVQSLITGAAAYRSGGGGGGTYLGGTSPSAGLGGLGGGGNGGNTSNSGTTNTGGGGGGGNQGPVGQDVLGGPGGNGGSGVVIIRVPSTVVAEFSAGVVYNYIPLDDFNVYEITAAGVSDTVTFSQGAVTTVGESLRFNDDDSAYLSRTPASAGNRKTWTWSGWVKRGDLTPTTRKVLFGGWSADSDSAYLEFGFGGSSGGFDLQDCFYATTATVKVNSASVFRDPSSWYHIVVVLDTTKTIAGDRFKLWVNGVDQNLPLFSPLTLNFDAGVNQSSAHAQGKSPRTGTNRYFDGYMSDVYFIDGQALDPSRFGKQDADGIWQPISYTGSYGTNGFHLDFADNSTAAALGTDTSGNGNNWTPSGITTDDQVTDTPSVNYCTLNPVDPRTTGTLSNGNLVTTGNASVTMRPTTGQYYYEKDGVGVSYDTAVSGPFDPVLPAGSYNFGQLPWADTGPTGAEVALNSSNLPVPTIKDGKAHFQPALYTGNGTTQAVQGLEFQPDFVWIKSRSSASWWHALFDAVRGAGLYLHTNSTNAEAGGGTSLLTSFDSNGFTVNTSPNGTVNNAGDTYVAWNWNAGGSTVTNTDGTITSQVRANTTAGFSIVSYTDNRSWLRPRRQYGHC
jgi:hypothetical protein